MARMTWEMVAWSGAGSSWVLCRTMEAANWLMSWDSLRVRLGMPQASAHLGRYRQACGNRKYPTTHDAIDAITRRRDETYKAYILRCKANDLARWVKLADLHDNLNKDRIPSYQHDDYEIG